MRYYGQMRVCGKGYENRNVIIRKKGKREVAFFLFLALFGATVYLTASALFHSALFGEVRSAFAISF